jgi:hypothetical protein
MNVIANRNSDLGRRFDYSYKLTISRVFLRGQHAKIYYIEQAEGAVVHLFVGIWQILSFVWKSRSGAAITIDYASYLRKWQRRRFLKPFGSPQWPGAQSSCAKRCGLPFIPAILLSSFGSKTMEPRTGRPTRSRLKVFDGSSRITDKIFWKIGFTPVRIGARTSSSPNASRLFGERPIPPYSTDAGK